VKNAIKLSLLLSTILSAGGEVFINPLALSDRAIDNGGTTGKSAIRAYQDGVGAILLDPLSGVIPTDNTPMNTLVFKYGESADVTNSTIANEVLSNTDNPSAIDINIANKLLVQNSFAAHVNGTMCDDGDSTTHGETWINDTCQGGISNIHLNGSPCDDGNPASVGESWLNDICQGGGIVNVYQNGTSCSDGNAATSGETWLNDVCQGGTVIASGTFVEWPKYNTPNGTCSGTFKGSSSANTVSYYKTSVAIKSSSGSGIGSDCLAVSEVTKTGYAYGWYQSTKELDNPSCTTGTLITSLPYYYPSQPSLYPYKTYKGTVYDRYSYPKTCAVCKTGLIYKAATGGCVAP
jgi:hypothetical protein